MSYLVIIEKGETGYGAYVPDLPGCIAAADTKDEVRQLIGEAIRLHLIDLQEQGVTWPAATVSSEVVEVA